MTAVFKIGEEINPEAFRTVLEELERRPLIVNNYRTNSGVGRSQCFGIVRQRNGTYTGSKWNYARPELFSELQILANRILPVDFRWLSIQVNQNYQTAPHYDKGNGGISAIVAFGDFTGGELNVEGTKVDIRHRIVYFDGSQQLHSTEDWVGNRYSLVFHTPSTKFLEVPRFGFVLDVRGRMMLEEDLSAVTRHYTRSGLCVFSSDGKAVVRKARLPTLRPCVTEFEDTE